ncbi:MAG: dTDP-4-dehydrorhamnose reductase [Chlamydiae bacterium]|nr:dTDP-4-dehydrorhamnose reductase [Chlamydiota bacterium]MBI3267247.1 dTDP-4-dehydrorhamnose reductase [Chlamydiota bacterium]
MSLGRQRVLILGANGMLGSDLVQVLKGDFEVFPFSHHELDITQVSEIERTLKTIRPAILINAASYTKVDDCETKEPLAQAVNGEAVGSMARLCQEQNVFLVHFSTDYVFDGLKRTPYVEEDKTHPINAYGRSKLKGEEAIFKNLKNFLLVRTSWLYGLKGSNFVDKMIELARSNPEKGLRVVGDQEGSPTYTRDLAKAIVFLLGHQAKGLIHVTNSGMCSWYDFAVQILKVAGLGNVPIQVVTSDQFRSPTRRPFYSVLSNARLEKEYGFKMRPWPEALEEYLKVQKGVHP